MASTVSNLHFSENQSASPTPAPHAGFLRGLAQTPGSIMRTREKVPPLPIQLRELQNRARTLVGHQLIREPGAEPLLGMAQQALAHLKQLDHTRRTMRPTDVSDLGALSAEIAATHASLDTLAAQIRLFESTCKVASWSLSQSARVLANERLSGRDLLGMLDLLAVEVAERFAWPGELIPVAGLDVPELVAKYTGQRAAGFLAQGVHVARLVLWSLGEIDLWMDRIPILVAGALFADLGRVALTRHVDPSRNPDETVRNLLMRQHPGVGAGAIGNVRGAPPELAAIIAQHHEQLDGGGYPRGLVGSQILTMSRIVGILFRFVELAAIGDGRLMSDGTSVDGRLVALRQLQFEATAGTWSLDFTRFLASRLESAMESARPANGTRAVHGAEPQIPDSHASIRNDAPGAPLHRKQLLSFNAANSSNVPFSLSGPHTS